MDEWKAKAATEEYQGADASVSSGFVNDDLAFEWFFLQVRQPLGLWDDGTLEHWNAGYGKR